MAEMNPIMAAYLNSRKAWEKVTPAMVLGTVMESGTPTQEEVAARAADEELAKLIRPILDRYENGLDSPAEFLERIWLLLPA